MKMSHEELLRVIPNRDPMQLVDEVIELIPGESVYATFLAKPEMEIFKGHLPGNPIFPGVYITEAAAQAGGLIPLMLPRFKGKVALLAGFNMRFKGMALPGDTLDIRVSKVDEREDKGLMTCHAEVSVKDKIAATGEITYAIR